MCSEVAELFVKVASGCQTLLVGMHVVQEIDCIVENIAHVDVCV